MKQGIIFDMDGTLWDSADGVAKSWTQVVQKEYKKAFGQLVTDATRQAQQSLAPAISALRDIVEDDNEHSSARIAAARSLLEYGLRLTEFSDILAELEAVEGDS